ncbi:MAG: cytochrome C [Helicobacteraceae bacterium CG2_30_36_10]|nr:MAG: cytochrome C [Helicobacteraceae bacterium CG2_30_36_10]
MKKIVVLLAVLGLSSLAMADAYQKCAACHGANGEKVALGKSKIISDLSKAEIVLALKGYQGGTYGGAMKGLMAVQVKGLSEADIEEIANKIGK